MVACPRCNFMNPVKQKACQACGTALPYASAPNHERPMAGRPTLRGMRSPEPPEHVSQSMPAVRADAPPGLLTSDQTMPSMVGPTPEQIRSHRANSTLLGHVSPAAVGGSVGPVSDANPSPVSSRAVGSIAHPIPAPASLHGRGSSRQPTLLGHAPAPPPQERGPDAPSRSSTSQTLPSMQAVRNDPPAQSSGEGGSEEDAEPPRAVILSLPESPAHEEQRITPHDNPARTYLAVAAANPDAPAPESKTSGVASTQPSVVYPALGSPPPLPSAARRGSASNNANVSPNVPTPPANSFAPGRLSRRAVQSRLGRAVLTLTASLGGGLLLFSWLWRPAMPVSGQINTNSVPATLDVACESCGDGSQVVLGATRSEFRAHRATLPLTSPPRVGPNRFALQIQRVGMGRDEQVELEVAVDYKARWDLSGLVANPAHLRVVLEAAPGVSIAVDGVDVALNDNSGSRPIELAAPISGTSSTVEWLDKAVTIVAKKNGSPPTESNLPVRLPVVPLTIDTPWSDFRTDASEVVISGRTAPGATVTSEQNTARADAAGYYELRVAPRSGTNNVQLVATAVDHVPRAVSASFERVASLTPVALAYQQTAVRRFDHLAEQLLQREAPVPVALAGKVQEWKTSRNLTVMLLSVTAGCPSRSCLVRVEYPALADFTPNQPVSVFGVAKPAPPGIGPLPLIQSHFILD